MAPELPEVWVARSTTPEATEALGEALGRCLGGGACLALIGELGSGKTTFVRGLARGLGVDEPVVSPTFTRMRVLPGRLALHHFDAWREGSQAVFAESHELLAGEGVAVVEWADRVENFLPRPRVELRFEHASPSVRLLRARVVPAAASGGTALRALETRLAGSLATALQAAGIEPLAAPPAAAP